MREWWRRLGGRRAEGAAEPVAAKKTADPGTDAGPTDPGTDVTRADRGTDRGPADPGTGDTPLEVWRRFGRRRPEAPKEPLGDEERAEIGLPRTLRPVPLPAPAQRSYFDPALKNFTKGYRAADPRFPDPAEDAAWRAARREALDLVLAAVAGSPWADSLVLRGSVLLSAWFGDAAREPGDIDFVVVPGDWGIEEDRTGLMLDGVALAAERYSAAYGGGVRLSARDAVCDDIWTYERVPGRRLLLPWSAPGLPGGGVQLDFVFNEKLLVPPERTVLADGTSLWAATPGLSLAWKLMWIINDMYPQGKDVFDAVLLAERHPLPYDVLRELLQLSGEWPPDLNAPAVLDFPYLLGCLREVDWTHSAVQYPHLAAAEKELTARLAGALRPAFPPGEPGESGEPGEPGEPGESGEPSASG
ncbi:nucleotidyl transferase AbiEii/AbiGii toxin family protein [Streptomyces uncialis]|uniref:nucleotidyl transferase AbiEii/AbiGii toxin family protein n=1 Tax=Streptomyces uncialis TaxID=1048205 RepID=UPI00381F220D